MSQTDLLAATRARLKTYLNATWPPPNAAHEVVKRDDLRVLLAAHDALLAAQDRLSKSVDHYANRSLEYIKRCEALEAERAQAAPVLAAAAGMVDDQHICAGPCVPCLALDAAVADWRRAAREG